MNASAPLAFLRRTALVLLLAGAAGCSSGPSSPAPAPAAEVPEFPRPAADEFSVMTFNLNQYALVDRDGSAGTLEPKPPEEADAILDVVRRVSPDVLAVQEMGDPAAWAEFKFRLREAGLDYPHEEYLRRGKSELNMGVLSRFPIVARNPHVSDTYTIGPTKFPVMRGFIDVDLEIRPDYRLRLMVAHLKSKVFHSFGQAEMRRNEARLLGNHVRASLKENPDLNLLVVGDLNDDPTSAALREITTYQRKKLLHDLRPADAVGDAWTHRLNDDTYHRIDYVLASDGLLREALPDKSFVVRTAALLRSSDHRPVVAAFAAVDRGPDGAPDLSKLLPPDIPQND